MTHSVPKKNTYSGNICAFCNFWEGDANLCSRSLTVLEYDNKATGICIKTRAKRPAGSGACSKFEISPNANRYVR